MLDYDLVIIGGGPAGLAAAAEAKTKGIDNILILDREKELGGILQQCIHNGFGLHIFKEELTGPEYAERFIQQIEELEIEFKLDTMVIELTQDKLIKAVNPIDGFLLIQAKAVILAMGCRERTRGTIAVPGSRPAGIFSAGTAQRYINMEGLMVGKKVMIIGSGDIGLIMARRLTLEGVQVIAVAELQPYSSGLTRNIVQCLDDYHIPLLPGHTITDIKGKERVKSVTLSKVDQNLKPVPGTAREYVCDTILFSVGLIPENELSKKAGIQLDPITHGAIVDESMQTNIKGVFACGNVLHVHDLVDYVTEEARKAGTSAVHYLQRQTNKTDKTMTTEAKNGITYIIPQKIHLSHLSCKLTLFMRVKKVYQKVQLIVKADNQTIKTIHKKHLAPGEMEHITIDPDLFRKNDYKRLTIEVQKEVK